MSPAAAEPCLWALLIGIDRYLPAVDAAGPGYPSLSGCVRDVERMEGFLRGRMGVPARRIRKLTAPAPPLAVAREDATYERMAAGLRWLAEAPEPGDQVLIHYSGHGGRTPTLFPQLKGEGGFDEALVPADVGRPSGRYLRDLELAWRVATMAEKGLFVTLVLDCCHAGGAVRREPPAEVPGPVARHNTVDGWRRPGPSLVAPEAELAACWRRLSGSEALLGGSPTGRGSGWLPALGGYVLLAACRPHERSYEYRVAPGQTAGALTHWLLDTLETRGTGITYRDLHERVHAQVRTLLECQTPQVEGEVDRRVFGPRSLQRRRAVSVLAADGGEVVLGTGEAQGVDEGARFAVFPLGWSNDDLPEERLAVVEVRESGGAESRAEVVERCRGGALEAGAPALPLSLGPPRRRRTVALALGAGETPDPEHRRALEAVRRALAERRSGFLEPVPAGRPAEHRVAVRAGGVLSILDAGGRELPNQLPALTLDEPGFATEVVERLVHLARYRTVEELANPDPRSPLHGKLHLELGRLPAGYDPTLPPEPTSSAGRRAEARVGDWLCLRMRNLAEQALNLTVLDLQPRWGIRQIHPARGDYLVLDPGLEERLPMQVALEPALERGNDRLKVFATLDATRFRWLELPSLGEPARQAAGTPAGELEELIAALAEDAPPVRGPAPSSRAGREWTVADAVVEVRRR